MTFLPVVERELRMAARRRGTYWSRLAAALMGWGVAGWILLASDSPGARNGALVFNVLAVLAFAYATVAGVTATSDCLSEEKREGTLGLLFLTDLKGYDVVFGKLAVTSVKSVYGMLAAVPALGISLVMGAVTWGEMLRVVLVALNLLFFFASVGLFASSVCRQDNRALGLAILLSAALLLGISAAIRLAAPHSVYPNAGLVFSPALGCFLAFDALYGNAPHAVFWLNALLTQVYAWSLLAAACRIVPRSWQDTGRSRWRRRMVRTKRARGAEQRKEVLAVNVFLWRAAQPGSQRTAVWLALLGVAALWFAADRLLPVARFDVTKDILTLLLAGVVLKGWLASEACATLSADRRNTAMELLLTTPLPEKEITKGQRLALWRQFAEPVGAVFLANMFLLIMEILQLPSKPDPAEECNLLVGLHVVAAAAMVVDLLALSWVGMWLGLVQRKPNRAALLALLRILTVPYLLFFVLYALAAGAGPPNWYSVLIFTSILGLVSSFFFAQSANANLLLWFRRVVADGVPPKLRGQAASEDELVLEGAERLRDAHFD